MARSADRNKSRWVIIGLFAVALVLRLLYVKWIGPPIPPISDASGYFHMGVDLADGHGFVSWTALRFQRQTLYSAAYPPLYPALLAFLNLLGIESIASQRVTVALLGALDIPLIALLGRALAGNRVGIIAAAIAAASPFLLEVDGSFMTESLYIILCLSGMLVLSRAAGRQRPLDFALAGLLFGFAALTRSEGVILFGLLVLPFALFHSPERRHVAVALALLGFALVVLPWTARNAVHFGSFIPISQSFKGVLAGANCDDSYYGAGIGSWSAPCAVRLYEKGVGEVEAFARYQRAGIRYMQDHPDALPRVVGARILRTLTLFRPGVWFGHGEPEVRNPDFSRRTIWVGWLTLALALPGAVIMATRSRLHAWLLMAPLATVILTSTIAYGNPRFRAAAEPGVIVLAALALSVGWERVRARRSSAAAD